MTITLQKRRLQGLTFKGETYNGLDLSSMSASGSKWDSCIFKDCEASLSDLSSAQFTDCKFSGGVVHAAAFRQVSMRHVTLIGVDLRHSSFYGGVFRDVLFLNCRLQYSSFADATVRSLLLLDSNLHGADLRFMEANHVDFRGSNLWNAQVQIGCSFFNGGFDAKQCDFFTGMVARVHPDEKKAKILSDSAGKQKRVLSRLMDDRDEGGAGEKTA
jgi:uncharacterized protein YjbI with pentapeptide repeats